MINSQRQNPGADVPPDIRDLSGVEYLIFLKFKFGNLDLGYFPEGLIVEFLESLLSLRKKGLISLTDKDCRNIQHVIDEVWKKW